ncbi:MAG: serine/threonine-protein kinase, partial [Candidatus Zixiibacteriota bacterium]
MKRPFEGNGLTYIGQLGRGGTAEVAKVFVDRLNCEAALKYPLPDESDSTLDFAELAAREYDLIGADRFPGLVRLLAPPHGNPDYLLLELCGGPTLDQVEIPSDSPLLLNVLCAAALDLEYLHAAGVIHGDIKPQNFFLPSEWQSCTDAQLFYVKLSDFSLGRHIAEREASRAGLGTVGYMPPETIRDGITSHRSDLFALGITAYQLITGRHPFLEGDADPTRVSGRILEDDPAPITSLNPKAPDALAKLVAQLLAKDPDNRPESAWSVCERLREIGAEYPFEKALHPRYFIQPVRSFDANMKGALAVNDREADQIRQLSCEDSMALRLIVTSNFRRGTLRYTGGAFTFQAGVLWPARLRNKALRRFHDLDFAGRKHIVRAAIIGDTDSAAQMGYFPADEATPSNSSLVKLIRPLLRSVTVKRLSRIPAVKAERSELYGTAANLFLQSGQLHEAERCAYQQCVVLIKDHRYEEALQLSQRVVDYAALRGDIFLVRELLMVQGDIHKLTGETARALETYQEIIELYDGHPVDKLLAETYKDIGEVYKLRQEVHKGIEALERALRIVTELGDELEISRVHNNLGILYIIEGDTSKALQTYRLAFATQRKLDALSEAATTLMNVGGVYFTTGRYRRSLRVLELALKMKKDTGDASEIARTLNNLGYVYHVGGDSAKGVQYLEESLDINRRIGSKKEVLFNLANLTEIMIAAGQLKQSLGFLKEGMTLSESLNDKPHLGQFLVSTGYVL